MDDVELIKSKINIVDLIQEYLPLKKAGINYKANCPFHEEKTPSFMVSPERGIWHCFGCGKGGDGITFIMEKEGLTFPETLELLASKVGVTLSRRKKTDGSPKEDILSIHQHAAKLYNYLLTEHKTGKKALGYLKERGLTDKTIKEFNLGYAPLSWETLTRFLRKKGFNTEQIIASGLAVPSQQGCYDRFRGRVMFPLQDIRHQIIGFSGRILGQGEPKYINSPQTLIFDKSRFLFCIDQAKQYIKESKFAILVEGEFDCLLSYQSGVKNVVATKGTAFTDGQIELLSRYTDTLYLCFDTDLAGDAAARKGIETADAAGLNIKVIELSGGKDPADVCLKDPDSWKKAIEQALPIYDYYLDSVKRRFDPNSSQGKKQIFAELLPIWRKITDPLTREHYIQKLSALLQVNEDLIRKQLLKAPTPALPASRQILASPQNKPQDPKSRYEKLQEYLLGLLLNPPKENFLIPNFPETIFTKTELKEIYILLLLYLDKIEFQASKFSINDFTKSLSTTLGETADKLLFVEIDEKLTDFEHWQKEVSLCVVELKKLLIKSSLERLSLQIKAAQAFNQAKELTLLNSRFRDLSQRLKNL